MSEIIERLNAALEGRYQIEKELGEGGMATVYLAEDLKHRRKVAIKVLRPELAAVVGAERFLAEIETTANLQHPHILPLFDSGQADSLLFYVMPYVEGESLRDRLDRRGEMPIDATVDLVTKVAAALQHAHERGVVHRDIKPANVLLQGGEPLVADFGIALAVSQAGGGRITETGLSLGTPHYMSPEQAEGERAPDPRSDIYSLACLTYEMLTGEPPHAGRTAQAILTKLLTADVTPPAELRSSVPPHVNAAVMKALQKLPADRFQEAKEFSRALNEPAYAATAAGAGGAIPAPAGSGLLTAHPALPWIGMGVMAVVAAGAVLSVLWATGHEAPPPPTTRWIFAMPRGQEILDPMAHSMGFSPDGSALVYVGPGPNGPQLWVKERGSESARPLPGTANPQAPEVDPTGRWVAYMAGPELRKMPLAGGPSVVVGDSAVTDIGSVAWLDDGTIAYGTLGDGIRQVSDEGTKIRDIVAPSGGTPSPGRTLTLSLSGLPGGSLLYVRCQGLCQRNVNLWVWDSSRDTSRILEPSVIGAWYVRPGYLVMVRPGGSVFGARFDPENLTLEGDPVPLFEGVQIDLGVVPDMEVSPSGRMLVQLGGSAAETRAFYWVNRSGTRTPVDPDFTFGSRTFQAWRLSPDGKRVAFGRTTDEGSDIWVKELDTGPAYRLTFNEALDYRPEWYPDGQWILFVSERGVNRDLYRRRANATGPVETVLERPKEISQGTISPDGRWLVYREGTGEGRDIWAFRPGQDSVPEPLIASPDYDEKAAAISPDGHWIAYESDETGQDEVYVRPFPAVEEGKWQISVGGGAEPVWAHSGREIFYARGDATLMAAGVDPGPPFSVGTRQELFSVQGILSTGEDHAQYDVAPDDQRFLMAIPVETEESGSVYWLMVDNWSTELAERLGGEG